MEIAFENGAYTDGTGRTMLDPTVYQDWQIGAAAERALPGVEHFREKLGLLPGELLPYGKTPKLDFLRIMERLKDRPDGKYIEVTAITPTPLGEGKSTTSLGLIEGLGRLGANVGGCLRQPSGGPTMNVKGTAAGGGNALLIPMTEFSLGLTGDINDIMNAHNLAMTALNARMQHERNYDDETLARRGLRRLDIDPARVQWSFVLDFCCQALRKMRIGLGEGKMDGYPMDTCANGQSSVIGDRLGLKLFDYHVTESGFAADIGFEKFWNVKCRLSGLKPDVSVLVATVRALKMHGGGPEVVPGRPLPEAYTQEDLALLEAGCANLLHHAETIRKSGITPVVCINRFYTDTDAELALVRRICHEHGLRCAVSDHWRYGGAGAEELAREVMAACEEPSQLRFLYPDDMPLRERVERIAREVYGAEGVDWSPLALEKAQRFESDPKYADYCTMMVKTHLSLSHDPAKKGVPTGWRLPVRDVLEYSGARFLCPVAGSISMMPGTGSDPAYRRIDVDTATGEVRGLF